MGPETAANHVILGANSLLRPLGENRCMHISIADPLKT
jgi:hypothetical protein